MPSIQSNKAIEWAIDLAEKYYAKITVVTVVKPSEFSPTIGEVDKFYSDAEKHYSPILKNSANNWEEYGVKINTAILRGHPEESIVNLPLKIKQTLEQVVVIWSAL